MEHVVNKLYVKKNIYHCSECACTKWGENWWFKSYFLWGIRACFWSFL